jgi:hypothetical protein
VTRGTRPKKPSSSRGFAREARGARGVRGVRGVRGFRGFRGLKTENLIFLISFQAGNNYEKNFFCVRTDAVFTASADGKNPSAGKTMSVW